MTPPQAATPGSLHPDCSDVPVVEKPEIMYLPRRAQAFGQAAFRYWPEQPIERHTFEVLCWANAKRSKCEKKDAVYALINCGWQMLLPLHPNARSEPQPKNL